MVSSSAPRTAHLRKSLKSAHCPGLAATTAEKTWVAKGATGELPFKRRQRWLPRQPQRSENQHDSQHQQQQQQQQQQPHQPGTLDMLRTRPKTRDLEAEAGSRGRGTVGEGEGAGDGNEKTDSHAEVHSRCHLLGFYAVSRADDADAKPLKVDVSWAWARGLLAPDSPVTVVLWSVPARYTRTRLCERLEGCDLGYAIDFLFLPIDAQSGRSMGYAIINLRTQAAHAAFLEAFHGLPASRCFPDSPGEAAVCEVSLAAVQGREANMRVFGTAACMKLWLYNDAWQPLFLADNGARLVFPSPPARVAPHPDASARQELESCTQLRPSATEFVPRGVGLSPGSWVSPMLRVGAPDVPSGRLTPDSDAHGLADPALGDTCFHSKP